MAIRIKIEVKNISGAILPLNDLIEGVLQIAETKEVGLLNSQDDVISSIYLFDAINNSKAVLVIDTIELSQSDSILVMKGIALSLVITKTTTTTDAISTVIDSIDNLVDNSMHFIIVKATAMEDLHTEWGHWDIRLGVTKISGVPMIQVIDDISHVSSAGLNSNSISFAINAEDIDVSVTGIAAKDIKWDFQYSIILISSN